MSDATPCERELAYYKRLVDELAAARLDTEHLQWALQAQLRQKNQGFLLLSRLTRTLAAATDPDAIFRTTVVEVNRVLGMDRTVALVPEGAAYRAAHLAGFEAADAERLARETFAHATLVPDEGLRLVRRETPAGPEVTRLRDSFGLVSFVCVPVAGADGPMGVVVSGRTRQDARFCPPLDDGDADTFRALASALTGVVQGTRLALREASQRSREAFFTELSHELRTPLSLVAAPLAQVLGGRWGAIPEAAATRLRVVERNQTRLYALVNEILELARLQAGATELRVERLTDVNALLGECAAHFRAAAEVRGLELRLALDPALGGTPVHADRVKLDRLVFNLLSNALKFTDAGHVELASRRDGDTLELTVSDSGIGIPPAELPGIFGRFVAGASAGRAPGSGIGLALCEEIARRHGGAITVTSEPGRGARFVVRLPLAALPLADDDAPGALERPPLPAPTEADDDDEDRASERDFVPGRPVVLCVEDDADLRRHLRDVLGGEANVFVAADGVAGLERARRYLPDVIVADQMMPRLGGRGLLEALRADPDLAAIPVLFLSARDDRASRLGSLAAGADDYVSKPFDADELCARVRNLVRAHRQARELAQANRRLELRVREQLAALVHTGELERYLAPAVVATLRGGRRAAPPPDHQRVSVLLVELDGLGGSHELEPAVLAGLVDEYLAAVSALASARGGTVDGLAGARLSVVFGAPEPAPPEASAWAALETAAEVRTRLLELAAAGRRRGLAQRLVGRLAVASGTALVGALGGDGVRAYTAVGAPVETAARLLGGARAAHVVCDAATQDLVADRLGRGAFRARDGGGFEVHELHPASPPGALAATVVPPPPPRLGSSRVFKREGDYWTIAYSGALFRLHDTKGLEYLARLLAQPHVELHALDLAAAVPGSELARGADAGPGLDAAAKRAYKSRLRELDAELAEAQGFADPGRTERLEAEVQLLAHQLSTAVGLGGRDRPVASVSERARINVSRGVKSAIDKIALRSATLARHLRASIRTGMFSSYAPPAGVPDSWEVTLEG